LLAALSIMCTSGFPLHPDFNQSPYSLGNFQTIATHEGAKNGGARMFSLGFKARKEAIPRRVAANYVLHQRRATLSELVIEKPEGEAALRLLHETDKYEIEVSPAPNSDWFGEKFRVSVNVPRLSREETFPQLFLSEVSRPENGELRFRTLVSAFSKLELSSAVSIAPIRTKPERTYEEAPMDHSSEGGHVPLLLASVLGGWADSESEESLRTGLKRFGEESGLLNDIDLRTLGDQPGDPFQ